MHHRNITQEGTVAVIMPLVSDVAGRFMGLICMDGKIVQMKVLDAD